ncbi:hypothetical protein CDL15_Pgr000705 [Punica granatum]|uniref:Pentatricopeptide repeat-containing protein At2g41720 n=1 Tax=Punica granatum TaxID=22663 RepID=A0A218W3X9_PUNGR|nr:hypothetical protein CDL15_Pgr000705 [Punica granatum]
MAVAVPSQAAHPAVNGRIRPAPALVSSRPTRRIAIVLCKKASNESALEETKSGFVDYDKGQHAVSTQISGFRKKDIPRQYRLRVEHDRFQKDWSVSEVAEKVLKLRHWEDIHGVLNRWVGRFARKNFPLLIKEITDGGSLEQSDEVFKWMKNQRNYCARKDIYNMMIRLHARHNRTDQARGLFFEMQKWRYKFTIPPSRSTYNNLINACGSSGNWREALKVCKKMTENGVGPDLVTHNIVLSAYKTGGQYSKALSYYELMKGTNVRPDTTTLNIVIHCLAKLEQFGKAVDVFNSMRAKRSECRPDIVTFTTIIHMYSQCGQIESCKAAFNTMLAEGMKPNIVSYNTLMGAYSKHGMSEEAYSVFSDIKRAGLRPDVVSYTSLLNAYGRSQQPQKARDVFEMMKRNKWKPNLVSYNALIDAYGSSSMLAEAVHVLREMEQEGIQPNIVSICTLLAACGRCRKKAKIDTVLSAAEMRGIELNTVAYNSAVGSYMNVGEFEKALNLFGSMKKKKVKPDPVTYTVLISGCCKMSKYAEALEFLDEMMVARVPLTKEGKLAEAESMFTAMKTAGCSPDVVTYTTMLHAYNAAENWEQACLLYQEMETNNIMPDIIAYSALMKSFNRGGQPSKVLVLAQSMREKDIAFTEATFFEMVSACSISGKTEIMMKLFYKIVGSGAEINVSTYSILLKNLLALGNWRKYIEVLQWMGDSGMQPSNGMYRDIYSFAQRSAGAENATIIYNRIGEHMLGSAVNLFSHHNLLLTIIFFNCRVLSMMDLNI